MSKKMDEKEARKYLAAFADGELDIEQNLELLEYMKMDSNATARVTHQQQLREAVDRTVRSNTPAMPAELRQSIEKLVAADEAGEPSPVAGRIVPVWLSNSLSVAAVVAFAAMVMFMSATRTTVLTPSDANAYSLITDTRASQFFSRHTGCTEVIERLHQYVDAPEELTAVPSFISQQLGSGVYDSLDLSNAGYEFVAAGDCRVPCKKAAHLVYRAKPETGRNDSISLWIAPDKGNLNIMEDAMYRARGPEFPHQIIVWRHAGSIYYLVGDFYPAVEKAYVTLASARK